MKILIVEDDSIYVDTLEILLSDMKCKVIGSTGDSSEAFRLIQATKPDLILLDIHLKGKWSGIEIAAQIQEKKLPVYIIFITSLLDDSVFEKAKNTNPIAYITKPIDKDSLRRIVSLALHKNKTAPLKSANLWKETENSMREDIFYVKVRHRVQKIHIPSIHYIEVDKRYSNIILEEKSLEVKIPLKELAQKLPTTFFLKVNKSCIINIQKIDYLDINKNIIKIGRQKILLSRRNKKTFMKALLDSKKYK